MALAGAFVAGLAVLYWWPLVVRVEADAALGQAALRVDVRGLLGRLKASFAVGREERFDAELRLLHVIPVRLGFSRAGLLRRLGALAGLDNDSPDPAMPAGKPSAGVGRLRRLPRLLRPVAAYVCGLPTGGGPGRRVRVDELWCDVRLGLGDAAATAVGCGVAWALLAAFLAAVATQVRLRSVPRVHVAPVFGRRDAAARGRVALRVAQGFAGLALASLAWRRVARLTAGRGRGKIVNVPVAQR